MKEDEPCPVGVSFFNLIGLIAKSLILDRAKYTERLNVLVLVLLLSSQVYDGSAVTETAGIKLTSQSRK